MEEINLKGEYGISSWMMAYYFLNKYLVSYIIKNCWWKRWYGKCTINNSMLFL